jgi:hypothetical protein
MYICIYIYIYIHIYVYIYTYIYIHVYIHTYIRDIEEEVDLVYMHYLFHCFQFFVIIFRFSVLFCLVMIYRSFIYIHLQQDDKAKEEKKKIESLLGGGM